MIWDNFAYKITANSIINTNKYNGIKYKSTCDSNGYTWWQKPSLNKYHIASFIQLNTNTKNRTMPHYDDNERWLPDGKSHHLDRKAKRLRLHPVLHLSQHCMINVMHIWQAWCIFDKYDAFYQNFSLQIYNRKCRHISFLSNLCDIWLIVDQSLTCLYSSYISRLCRMMPSEAIFWPTLKINHFQKYQDAIVHSDHLGESLHIVNAERRNG